jgi:DNA-binding MarR family transcriptional regulator
MSKLEQSTGFLVVRTARTMKKALDARLTPLGSTASQHTVLSTLAENGALSLSEIGKRIFLDKPAITGLADRLEQDNLVERRRSLDDRRVIKLHITSKGKQILEQMDSIARDVDDALVEILSVKELNLYRDLTVKIWQNANN